jgi:uncharacterized protein YcfJ
VKNLLLALTVVSMVSLSGCRISEYHVYGVAAGTAVGAGVGAVIGNNSSGGSWAGAGIGAGIGAVVGLIAGDMIDRHMQRNFERERDIIMRYNQEYLDRMSVRYE